MAYIETSNLDGETNLKIRQGDISTSIMVASEHLETFKCHIDCELPNRHLYEFHGSMHIDGHEEAVPLGMCARL
jgi:phospholipid-transporting ATPase